MAMNKIERIDKEIAKTREKITEYQNRLRGLEAQKTEAENLQIVQLVRSMRLSPHELSAMLSGGGIPGMEAAPGYPAEPADHDPKKWRTPRMNKKILRTLTALCAALMLTGGFSVTAFAQTPEGQDATDDSGVVYEEPEKEEPLTPDGNATLVDDFGGNKQLITVTTKNGNYFYILIDRDDEGEDTVHFLNQVDEADLLALMEDGSTEAAPPAVCSCTDKCEAGKVNVSCPVCKDNMTACSGKEAEPETEKPTEQPKEKGNTGGLVLFLVVALLGGGGAFYYFKFMKPKQNVKGDTDLEDFDFDDYDEDEGDGLSDEEQEDEEA